MKLRNITIALALLVPAAASAGPIPPAAALSNEIADLSPAYEAPITGSQPLVTASHYVYETSFHVSLFSFVPPPADESTTPPPEEQPLRPLDPTPVPEPSTLLLVGSSLAVAAVRKARARRKQLAEVQ